MITELGRFLRSLRSSNDEFLLNMANKLDISPSLLSSIENGKRNIPKNFAEKVTTAYGLSEEQVEQLFEAVARTKKEVSLNLEGLSAKDQNLAFSFARRFSDLDEESKQSIQKLLGKGERR